MRESRGYPGELPVPTASQRRARGSADNTPNGGHLAPQSATPPQVSIPLHLTHSQSSYLRSPYDLVVPAAMDVTSILLHEAPRVILHGRFLLLGGIQSKCDLCTRWEQGAAQPSIQGHPIEVSPSTAGTPLEPAPGASVPGAARERRTETPQRAAAAGLRVRCYFP